MLRTITRFYSVVIRAIKVTKESTILDVTVCVVF